MATKAGNLRGGKEVMPAYNNFVCVCARTHVHTLVHGREFDFSVCPCVRVSCGSLCLCVFICTRF